MAHDPVVDDGSAVTTLPKAPLLSLHACWGRGALLLWAEDAQQLSAQLDEKGRPAPANEAAEEQGRDHPWAADVETLRAAVGPVAAERTVASLRLPRREGQPAPSPHAAHLAGEAAPAEAQKLRMGLFRVPALALAPPEALRLLLQERWLRSSPTCGEDLRFFAALALFACALAQEENIAPMLVRAEDGELEARWFAWHSDEATRRRLAELLEAAPASVTAAQQGEEGVWPVVEQALHSLVDARCREMLGPLKLHEALQGREQDDPHVQWLGGLVGPTPRCPASREQVELLLRGARRWLGRLEDRGENAAWRLRIRVLEPDPEQIPTLGAERTWRVELALTTREAGGPVITAAELWSRPEEEIVVDGVRLERGHDLLLAELDRACRLSPLLEKLLRQEQPAEMTLGVREAHRLLREDRPILLEQGVDVQAPAWWEQPQRRLGARLTLEPLDDDEAAQRSGASEGRHTAGSDGGFEGLARKAGGLEQMVQLRWRVAVGDREVDPELLERWAREGSPLVRFEDRWIELLDEDLDAARELLRLSQSSVMPLRQAIGVALGAQRSGVSLPVVDVQTTGWLQSLMSLERRTRPLEQPVGFLGQLRPYQLQGLAWLDFLEAHGLGGCLADDMGLGKTIQVLALLLHEREQAKGAAVAPTLLVVPTSVMTNWLREGRRFAPSLKLHPHHGPQRLRGEALAEKAGEVDAVVTTYALAQRDVEDLRRVHWRRIVLDEAQKIKNPQTKQTRALASLSATTRIALTGTPVENHLTDLWSIMHFCNPGLLGPLEAFRRNVAGPIEREHDESKRRRLRALIRPFLLRRVKSDPAVEIDLPEKIETREHCALTLEQASLYEQTVERMLAGLDAATGQKRRGVILAGLTRLKQICNHPAQALSEPVASARIDAGFAQRSGKCQRLLEMLEEVVEEGDQAIVFTQFRVMAEMLAALLCRRLDRDALLLHGGVSRAQRQRVVDRFQRRDGSAPVLVLSLKAGGVGMNLTAASHVFHFDRWWNPAVEDQATDRAHRIGQTRTVHVHKFVVAGTLEERIDAMLEEKTDLARSVVGSGEQWLTELSTQELRDVLTLRREALEEDRSTAIEAA